MSTIKLLIAIPDGRIHKLKFGPINSSFREAPLTATTLAGLIPEDLDIDTTISDGSLQEIPKHEHFDMVAISVITGTAYQAYELSRHFRNNGTTVILGGVHVTLLPEEAVQHADAIVVGFAEKTWPELLYDFVKGKLKKRYIDLSGDQSLHVVPRRDLQKKWGYMSPYTVSATRGCKGTCDFCAVPAAKFGWHKRPIPQVLDEVRSIPGKRIVFNDVSMGEDMGYFKELLSGLKTLHKKWGGLVSTKVFKDPEILDLLKDSGCIYLLIGFESINSTALQSIKKSFNKLDKYKRIIEGLREIDVVLMGTFIFGFDEDGLDVFENTVDFVNEAKINIPRYAIYTPYPGTESYNRLNSEKRLLHNYWPHYDTQHVVFQPKQMTVQQLDSGFRWAYKKSFGLKSILNRTLGSGKNFPVTFAGNLAYNIYIKKLFSDSMRIYSSSC